MNFMIDFDAPPLKEVLPILKRGLKIERLPLPRALKPDAEKLSRTRTIAEVFTPSRIVKQMIDATDDGRIDSRWLEIACGEAPFITNRYDAETGAVIALDQRAGILDRKLRRAKNFHDIECAVQSVYGCELQADSLLIARANVLLTAADAVHDISAKELADFAEVISKNFWQTDLLNPPPRQLDLFEAIDWNTGDDIFLGGSDMKKFDFVIGNPPYQDIKDDNARQPPVYDKFMEAAYKVGETVELITPARFLFNAGQTSKDFNQRMLNDPHFKVLKYEPDARKVFKNVEIKGGVAITLRDETRDFGAIKIFTPFPELNSMHQRICVDDKSFRPLSEIVYTPIAYKLSEKFFSERPDLIRKLQKPDDNVLRTNIFERVPELFFDNKPDDGSEYVEILGLQKNQRVFKWIRRDYISNDINLDKWKVFVPKANGSGALGEVLSTPLVGSPLVGSPLVGATQTFISVGAFDSEAEARACLAYIKSKFARVMLGILKVTQDNPPSTWAKVPLQDFTASSDIDWGGDIDEQLYRKYGLDAAEIKFIETNIREMT